MVTHDAPLSYTITTAPIQGTVTVNQSGWFSYAPTDAARFRAGLSPVTDTDSFTVIVNDGHGGVTPVVVHRHPDLDDARCRHRQLHRGQHPRGVALNPEGTIAYVANGPYNVSMIDTASGDVIADIPDLGRQPPAW